MEIRFAVQENRLSDPTAVTAADCEDFVLRGLFWVAKMQGQIVGFAAADDRNGTIWALFIDPLDQGRGIGAGLLTLVCNDLAVKGHQIARLTTDPGTRADRFYRREGWIDRGLNENNELQFERAL